MLCVKCYVFVPLTYQLYHNPIYKVSLGDNDQVAIRFLHDDKANYVVSENLTSYYIE